MENILNNPPEYKRKSNTDLRTDKRKTQWKFENQLAFVILFLLIIVYAIFGSKQNTDIDNKEKSDEIKPSLFRQLKNSFPNQTKGFYSNIISCYKHSIIENSDPAIIILVSDKQTTKNVNCVAQNLVKLLIKNQDVNFDHTLATLKSSKYKNKDSEYVKKELDEDLINIFSAKNGKIALIENIENIPAQSMILFYTYGDDITTSKYKGIIILFTYELNGAVVSNNKEKHEELTNNVAKLNSLVEKDINDRWSVYIDYDQLKPLYTRIANNIILVNNEQSCE